MNNKLTNYCFSEIATNNTTRISPVPGDEKMYIGLEHINSDVLSITDWGSDTVLIGDKFKMSKGDVLFARRNAYLRRVGIAPFDGIYSAHGMIFRPIEKVIDSSFFPFFIKSNEFMDRAVKISVGSMSPTVNWKDLKKEVFALPPIDEQKRYAKLLWNLENLIENYKHRLVYYDQLVKSRFVELFQDYDKVPLTDLANITMGQSPDSSTYNDAGIGVPFFQGKTEFTDTFVKVNKYCSAPKKMAKKMDILMSVRAPVGSVNLTNQECCIGRGLAAITPKPEIADVWYLFNALKMMEQEISNMGVGSTFTAINKEDMGKIKIPAAPIKLQREFADFVKQVDKSKLILQTQIQRTLDLQMSILDTILIGGDAVAQ